MAHDEVLARIDAHMERGNELMERGNTLMERGNVLMDRGEALARRSHDLMDSVQDELRLSREQHADLRQFIREMNMRAERFTQRAIEHLERLGRKVDANSSHMEDLREQGRAQTEALLRVLDRLPPGPSAA